MRASLAVRGLSRVVRYFLLAAFASLALGARAYDGVLTLDEAIRLALEHNQRIKVSSYGPQIARANVLAQYGAFDPAITFNRSLDETEAPGAVLAPAERDLLKTDNYGLALGGFLPTGLSYSIGSTAVRQRDLFSTVANEYTTFAGVSVTQPLLRGFGFGANLANLRVAKANRGISDWQHKQTVIDTVTNVIYTFNNLQLARESVHIARFSRDLAAQTVDENEKRHRVGDLSTADVTEARARLASREESILINERSAHDVENQLRELIGEDQYPIDGPPIATAELPPIPTITENAAEDVKVAYDERPDYQAARLGIKINRANLAAARNLLLPQLDFVGSYGYGGFDPNFRTARLEVRNEDARAYSVGMVVSIPLTFAQGRGRSRAASLTVRQSEADLVRLKQDIAVSVATAAGQLETTKQRVIVTERAVTLQQQTLEDAQKKFKAGTVGTQYVLQEQEYLISAQSSYTVALANERSAVAFYDHELGRTLQRYNITLALGKQ